MRILLSFLVSGLIVLPLSGQEKSTMFEKAWGMASGNVLYYADELPGGDFFLVGESRNDTSAPVQLYAARITSAGELLWENEFGDIAIEDPLHAVIKSRQGTYLLVGTSFRSPQQIHALHLDANGQTLFDDYLGSGNFSRGFCACENIDGTGFVITGCSYFPAFVPVMYFVSWSGQLQNTTGNGLSEYLPAYMVAQEDGYLVAGSASPAFHQNAYVAKYSPSGILQWIRYPYGQSDTIFHEVQQLIASDNGTFDLVVTEVAATDTLTRWKTFDAAGNLMVDVTLSQPVLFNTGENTGPLPAAHHDERIGFYGNKVLSGAGDKSVTTIAATADPAVIITYAFRTADGGCLAVGCYAPGATAHAKFYAVKFSAAGNAQADLFEESVTIGPNPAMNGNLVISFDVMNAEVVDIRIWSADGRLVYSNAISCPASSHTVLRLTDHLSGCAPGYYLVQVGKQDAVVRKKIVVLHE